MIKQQTFDFLSQLALNNNRDWFLANKNDYEQAKQNIIDFTTDVLAFIKTFDKSISDDLAPKKCVLRIYRDIRFSKIKTPYKTNFGISISAGGKNLARPGYYLHIEPNKCFVAGGFWQPEASMLKAIRQEIDYNTQDLLQIIEAKEFKVNFGALEQTDSLKLAPKGYPADHPYIDLLKLKSFVAIAPLPDKELMKDENLEKLKESLSLLFPLNNYLLNAIIE